MKRFAAIVLGTAMLLAAPVAMAQGGGAEAGSDPLHSGDGGTIKAGGNSSHRDTARGGHRFRHRHHHRRHHHHR